MSRDKQRLLQILDSLEADYQSGKISEDKYHYFRSKYMDKLNNLERSNYGSQIPNSLRKQPLKPKSEEEKLIEKFILNPKNNKKKPLKTNKVKKESKPMDSSTFKLSLVLVLVVAFTVGIGIGVFGFDFGDISILNVDAIVEDSTFPEVKEVNTTNMTKTNTTTNNHTVKSTNTSSKNSTPTPTPKPVNSTLYDIVVVL